MINITSENRQQITEKYVQYLMDNMDDNSIYALAYDCVINSKNQMSNESLSQEIQRIYPSLIEE
jgi:hypothetical protein